MEPLRPPSLRHRAAGLFAAWLLIFAASPGVLLPNGSAALAAGGVALWGAWVVRPLGPRPRLARLAEWGAGGLGWVLLMLWVWYVVPFGLVYIALGGGLYVFAAGALARLLARVLPPGAAAALGWVGVETLRTFLVPPFGIGWWRLGHQAHDQLWLAGSARVWGVEGLSLVLAALAGVGAELLLRRRPARATLALAAGALVLGVLLSGVTSPPATVDGPRVLLVQPAFPQARKQFDPPEQNFGASLALTFQAVEALRDRGEPELDLVCWGETMLYLPLFEPEAVAALEEGVEPPPWWGGLDESIVRRVQLMEEAWVRGRVLGLGRRSGPRLAEGTSFLVGAEVFDVVDGALVRRNAIVVYDGDGARSRPATKRYLVPGAETMGGLERFEGVRRVVDAVAGYVPDFTAAEEVGVLEIKTRDGRGFRIGATVCFDNGFLGPYAEAVAEGAADFHVVASNEAWYRESFEMDQMLAFSRVIALSTGRSVVRATNSGLSVVIGPDGRELGRVREGGRDRSVPGTLALAVPVPAPGGGAIPFYSRHRQGLRIGLLALVLAGAAAALRRGAAPRGNRAATTG